MAVLDAFDLTGKTAVVTGGNTGLGEAFAKALAEAGAGVALAARSRERSEAVADEIRAPGGNAIAVGLDVTDPAQVHGMLEAVTDTFPGVSVGYIGLERDEETLEPTEYYEKLPPLEGKQVLLLDPMLATGGSAARAAKSIMSNGPASLRMICVVAAPEGVRAMEEAPPDVPIFAGALDRELNDRGYILPGIGDFGDRLYGTEP